MDLREKITTLLSVCNHGTTCEVRIEPVDGEHSKFRACAALMYCGSNDGRSGLGPTEEHALERLWENVQREARQCVSVAESTLETVARQRDSAAREAQFITDRLAWLRMTMRATGANQRDPGVLHEAPASPTAPTRSKIAAVWGWCFERKGTVQTEETVRDGKPWRHAWVDEDGQLALHGYGATDEAALADLWREVQGTEKDMRAAREAQMRVCNQRIHKDQQTRADLTASFAELDRILAEENGT